MTLVFQADQNPGDLDLEPNSEVNLLLFKCRGSGTREQLEGKLVKICPSHWAFRSQAPQVVPMHTVQPELVQTPADIGQTIPQDVEGHGLLIMHGFGF